MKRLIWGVLLAVALHSPAWAVTDYFIPVQAGSSAQTARMGHIGGFTNLSDAVYDNPAALDDINQFSASIFQTTFMGEATYQNLSAAIRIPGGVVGVGLMRVGVDGFTKTYAQTYPGFTDYDGDLTTWQILPTGNFGYNNMVMKAVYQFTQNNIISWGIGATYYTTSVDTLTGSGVNFDAGAKFNLDPLVLSVSIQNLVPGLGVKYSNGGQEKLPLHSIYAASYRWEDFKFLGQLEVSDGANKKMLRSAAVNYAPSFLSQIQGSIGYHETAVGRDSASSITMGLGLQLDGVNFDYGYETSENIMYNSKHYFSLGFSM